MKKVFSSEERIKFTQVDRSNSPYIVGFDRVKVESDSAIRSKVLSEGKSLPVLSTNGRTTEILSSKNTSMIDSKSNHHYFNNTNFPTQLNCGNCHDNYHQAWLSNLNNSTQMIRHNLFIYTDTRYLSSGDLEVLDLIKFIPTDRLKNQASDPMSGNYIVTEKHTSFDKDGFHHRVRVSRDFMLD